MNMESKLKNEIQKALKFIRKFSDSKFHVKIGKSDDVKYSKFDSIYSCELGEYSAKKLLINSGRVQSWVKSAMTDPDFPINVKFINGILFVQSEPEPEIVRAIEPEPESFIGDLEFEPNDGYFHDLQDNDDPEPKPKKKRK